jgi:hypothetical protein
MNGNLTTRQQVLELEPTQVCEPTRLSEGESITLEQENGNLLAQFRLRDPCRLQERVWYRKTHVASPLGMRNALLFREPRPVELYATPPWPATVSRSAPLLS